MTMLRRAIVLVLLLATVSWGRAAIERTEIEAGKSLLYLPNGKYLKTMSMGHPSVLADWMYIWRFSITPTTTVPIGSVISNMSSAV